MIEIFQISLQDNITTALSKLSHYNALLHVGYLKLVGKYSNYSSLNKELCKKTAINHSIFTKKHTHNNKKEIEACAPIPIYRLKSFLIRWTVLIPLPVSWAIVLIL